MKCYLSLLFLFLAFLAPSKLWAQESACAPQMEIPVVQQARSFSTISASLLMEYSWPCARGVLQGAWDATGGLATSAGKCVLSPIKCARKAKEAMENAYSFFSNISSQVSLAFAAISNLPATAMAEIICSTIGSVAPGALVAVLSGGAGAGALALTLAKVGAKIAKLASLAAQTIKLPLKVLAKLGSEQLERVKRMVDMGFEQTLQASMGSCQ